MTSSKTVVIVGAGASKEFNLPVGDKLKEQIAEILHFRIDSGQITSGDNLIREALFLAQREHKNDINKYFEACSLIKKAMPLAPSIDNFLDIHQGNTFIEQCGKLAIVRTILAAEALSTLSDGEYSRVINFEQIGNPWLIQFMQLLTQGCKASDLPKRFGSVVFIIFNYDRCIEHFVYHWLQVYYNLESQEALDLLKTIRIFHPYGTVGSLPGQSNSSAVQFGATLSSTRLLQLANEIKTFSEGTHQGSSHIDEIRAEVRQSSRLVFLGFAYHKINMELLFGTTDGKKIMLTPKDVFGTAFRISTHDRNFIIRQLEIDQISRQGSSQIHDVESHVLINQHQRGLAF